MLSDRCPQMQGCSTMQWVQRHPEPIEVLFLIQILAVLS
jgi:hypothetical protein